MAENFEQIQVLGLPYITFAETGLKKIYYTGTVFWEYSSLFITQKVLNRYPG